MSRSYAYRIVNAAKVTKMLPLGDKPTTERVARELVSLKVKTVDLGSHGRETSTP
jgi:hypothetical protein